MLSGAAGLDEIERSEVIASACEQVRGSDVALDDTVAMGLTAQEAEQMRIDYTPLEAAV